MKSRRAFSFAPFIKPGPRVSYYRRGGLFDLERLPELILVNTMPCTARTDELSATTREKSSLSAPRSLSCSTRCSLCHTPAFCQARTRRQHVMPEPHPISWGSISHGIPDCKTNRNPVNTRRSSSGLRPGCVLRRRLTGSSGCTISQSSSSTSSRAYCLATITIEASL